jgi:acetyltransferase
VAYASENRCSVELWSLTAADRDVVRRLVDGLSAETLYRRFHRIVRPSDVDLSWLDRLAADGDLALVASRHAGGDALGLARAVRYDASAEIAVTVADAWQGRRIGTCLARRLADELTGRGVLWLSGVVAIDNRPAVALMRGLGARAAGPVDWGAIELRAPLPRAPVSRASPPRR